MNDTTPIRVRLKERPILSARPYGTQFWILEDLNEPEHPGTLISKADLDLRYEVVQ